jgi:O-antigen/teichoic acid export membrane protein
LFTPLTQGDLPLVNGVLAATRNKFRKIGVLFLAVGAAVAGVYAWLANSALPNEFIATVIMMTVVPVAFNLFYATTYRVLLQTQQKEYVINLISIVTLGLGHTANIVMIRLGGPMWAVRFITMAFALLNSLLIAGYVKKRTPYLDLKQAPRPEKIKGTNDVMIQRITGVIYSSAPIVFLSVSPSGGTVLASVYAVYNNVFLMIKSLLHSVIDAPRLSFGQLMTEKKREEVWPVFAQYEYAAFMAVFVLLTTCSVLILPFIGLYTNGIRDANYYDVKIALLMVGIATLELIHIPSGHIINMAGKFKVSRNIQVVACAVLVAGMLVGGGLWGVYGMLLAILLVAALLCIMEMGYIHTQFFEKRLLSLARLLLPLMAAGIGVSFAEMQMLGRVDSYGLFAALGVLFVVVNGAVGLALGLVFNRRELLGLLGKFTRFLPKK